MNTPECLTSLPDMLKIPGFFNTFDKHVNDSGYSVHVASLSSTSEGWNIEVEPIGTPIRLKITGNVSRYR